MSPVVATLILILIAVAAAAALYLWLVAWQGGVTGGIGSPSAQYTVTIGGSTSVYPFSQVAVQQFEQNNSNVVISNNQGGSGAGMLAVCHGAVDIGASSSPHTVQDLQQNYGCPSSGQVTVTTVAYDAVDAIVPTANVHGLNSISWDTLLGIYVAAGDGGSFAGLTGGLSPSFTYSFNGASAVNTPTPGGTGFNWGQIPACATAAATCSGTAFAADTPIGAGVTTPCVTVTADVCYTGAGSPCGWNVCTGPAVSPPLVQTWLRSDISGTTQSFTSRLLAVGHSGTTLGYGGCGSDGNLGSCGLNSYPSAQQGNGNPAVVAGVASHPDAIGYASDGIARQSTSGVAIVSFQGLGQSVIVSPTLGSAGTISAGIKGQATGYVGWRPFIYVTLNPPTGEVQRYIQFVLIPANNINFAAESLEVSVYSI